MHALINILSIMGLLVWWAFMFPFFVIVEDTTSHMFCIKYNNSTIYNNTTVHVYGIIMYDKRNRKMSDTSQNRGDNGEAIRLFSPNKGNITSE